MAKQKGEIVKFFLANKLERTWQVSNMQILIIRQNFDDSSKSHSPISLVREWLSTNHSEEMVL